MSVSMACSRAGWPCPPAPGTQGAGAAGEARREGGGEEGGRGGVARSRCERMRIERRAPPRSASPLPPGAGTHTCMHSSCLSPPPPHPRWRRRCAQVGGGGWLQRRGFGGVRAAPLAACNCAQTVCAGEEADAHLHGQLCIGQLYFQRPPPRRRHMTCAHPGPPCSFVALAAPPFPPTLPTHPTPHRSAHERAGSGRDSGGRGCGGPAPWRGRRGAGGAGCLPATVAGHDGCCGQGRFCAAVRPGGAGGGTPPARQPRPRPHAPPATADPPAPTWMTGR